MCCAVRRVARAAGPRRVPIASYRVSLSFRSSRVRVFPGAVSLKTKMDALLKSFVNKCTCTSMSDTTSCDGGVAKHLIPVLSSGHLSRHRGKALCTLSHLKRDPVVAVFLRDGGAFMAHLNGAGTIQATSPLSVNVHEMVLPADADCFALL